MMEIILKVNSLNDTKKITKIIASYLLANPLNFALSGDLGAGKTTFTQLLGNCLGIEDYITSPTFTIMKRYETDNIALNHFDLYRIKNEVYEQGFEEFWYNKEDINIIEWSEYLPSDYSEIIDVYLNIKIIDSNRRLFIFKANESFINFLKEHLDEFIY